MTESVQKVVETASSFFKRTEDGIIVTWKKKDTFVDLDNAKENCDIHRDLANDSPKPCMIIMSEMQNTSPEALEYYAQPEHSEYRSAEAFVVKSLGVKLIVDHHKKNSQLPYPIEVFENEDDAMEWLRKFL